MKKILVAFLCGIRLFCLAACGEGDGSNARSTESTSQREINDQSGGVFNTENIKRITFYAYYGYGRGSDVPAEHLDEIIAWLASFDVDTDRELPTVIPPGTNSIHVEIEYFDGSIVKQGMDTAVVGGVTYYISGNAAPQCYDEIISKASLN
jgi:hypothetical protein